MLDHLDRKAKRLYLALMANFIALGVSMTVFGATVPQIIDGFGWDYLTTGIVMAAGACGGFISAFACGRLLRRVKAKLLLVAGLACLALTLVLFGKTPSAVLNGIVYFLMGIGSGFSEVITNSAVVRMERPGESRLMNLMHAGFCAGAVIGPVTVSVLSAARVRFGDLFSGAGLFQLAIIALILLQDFPRMESTAGLEAADGKEGAPPKAGGRDRPMAVWQRPLFWALIGAMFLYVGVEFTYNSWISEFAARHRSMGPSLAAAMVSVFWSGLLAGRIILSFAYRGKRQERMLALLAAASVLFFFLTAAFPASRGEASPPAMRALSWACAFLTGLCFSGCYPIIVSILGEEFAGSTTVLGICSSAAGIGTLIFPLATGWLAASIGLPRAFLAAAGVDACLAGCAIAIALGRRGRARAVA